MKIIYLVYTDLHVNLSKSLSTFFSINTLGPTNIKSDYKISNKMFDFRSFFPIFIFLNKKRLQNIINNYEYIGISCINFSLNNIIFSNHNSHKVFITYDGLINLQCVDITFKEKVKDIVKYILFSFRGIKYTIRNKTISGIDILKCRPGFVDISKHIFPIHFFLNINLKRFLKSDVILYISIANDAIDLNKYLHYEKVVIHFITNHFNKPIKIIYKTGINSNYINKELSFNRNEMNHLTAEEIIYLYNFENICGDVSSLLFNTKILNPTQKVYSICLDTYCKLFEKSMLKAYTNSLQSFDIKILNQTTK
jgi:hypothetical protein